MALPHPSFITEMCSGLGSVGEPQPFGGEGEDACRGVGGDLDSGDHGWMLRRERPAAEVTATRLERPQREMSRRACGSRVPPPELLQGVCFIRASDNLPGAEGMSLMLRHKLPGHPPEDDREGPQPVPAQDGTALDPQRPRGTQTSQPQALAAW